MLPLGLVLPLSVSDPEEPLLELLPPHPAVIATQASVTIAAPTGRKRLSLIDPLLRW
jgi:hypothetical protein